MTTSNEQAAQLPLIKRLVLAIRGGVPSGLSAVLLFLLIALVLAIGVGGFLGGMALATQRNQTMERNLLTKTREAHQLAAKAVQEKHDLEAKIAQLSGGEQDKDKQIEALKLELERARVEREAMDKMWAELRASLAGTGSPVEKAAKGALLKFSDKECELAGGALRSKEDVKCLNLREAIDAMNGVAPAAPEKPAAPPAAMTKPAVKPAPKPAAAH